MPRLLNGEVEAEYVDAPNQRLAELERENGDLRHRLQIAELEASHAKEQVTVALTRLRSMTLPFYQLLRAVHGEIDALGIEDAPQAANGSAAKTGNPKWDNWKQKMPGRPAEMIDLLLLHENMSTKQLMAAMHCAKDTVYQAAYKLGQAGLVVNNGGRYSLKEI